MSYENIGGAGPAMCPAANTATAEGQEPAEEDPEEQSEDEAEASKNHKCYQMVGDYCADWFL